MLLPVCDQCGVLMGCGHRFIEVDTGSIRVYFSNLDKSFGHESPMSRRNNGIFDANGSEKYHFCSTKCLVKYLTGDSVELKKEKETHEEVLHDEG